MTQRQDTLEDKVFDIEMDQSQQTETISKLDISQKAVINKLARQVEIISTEVKGLHVERKEHKIDSKSDSGIFILNDLVFRIYKSFFDTYSYNHSYA